jgi:hypothetical protein
MANSESDVATQIARSARIVAIELIEAFRLGDIVIREYINQQSAACYCGYSEQFFNKVCRAGNGPRHVRVGSRWRTRRIWLDQWMESGGPHGALKKVES